MTPTRTDGVDDFFEAAKDIRDQLDTFASTKSFAERLDSHEKMRARQRHRDMAEAAIKSQQLLKEQNRLEKERLSLLQREAREREEEKLRVSRLPRCPDCRSPIDGGRPSLCAQCRSRLLWILNEPVNETEANKYLSEPCSHSLTESICGQVNEAIESLRVAARAIPMSPSRKSYGYNELVERCEQIRHLWLTDRQAREKDVETQIAEVESSQSLALNKSNSVGCWWGCVQIVLLIAALGCFAVWLLQMIEQQTFANRAGSYLMVCLISVVFVRIISQSQVAWVSRRDVFDQKLQDLRDQLAACRTPPAEASAASVFLDANETVRGVMTVVDNLDSDWKKLAQHCGRNEVVEVASLQQAMRRLGEVLCQDFGQSCVNTDSSNFRDTQGAIVVDSSVEATAQRLLQALCVVAAADGKLEPKELKVISDAVKCSGCPLNEDSLLAIATDTCKAIYKSGVSEYAQRLCSEWAPLKGTAFAKLALRLQRKVAAADGRTGVRESQLLSLFRDALAGG